MTIKEENLLEKALEIYGMSLPEFAEAIEVPKSTLQNWKEGKTSTVGQVLLKTLIRNHELEKKIAVLDAFKEMIKE